MNLRKKTFAATKQRIKEPKQKKCDKVIHTQHMNSITFELQHSQIFEENVETVLAYCKLSTVVTRYGRFNINAFNFSKF